MLMLAFIPLYLMVYFAAYLARGLRGPQPHQIVRRLQALAEEHSCCRCGVWWSERVWVGAGEAALCLLLALCMP